MMKNSNKLVSVIIPCYNCSQTIDRCLTSVLENTYSKFEIICIDDGSSDNTLEILETYQKLHKNLFVIKQNNYRQGYARNRGIESANGDYVAFLDSDDTYDKTFLEVMINAIDNYDVVICGYDIIHGGYIDKHNVFPNGPLTHYQFWRNNFANPVWAVVPWNKLIKKECLTFRFKEDVYYEDEFFTNDLLLNNIFITAVSNHLYNYYDNINGTMHTNDVYKKLFHVRARIERSNYFIDNNWELFHNKTSREALYLLLKIQDLAKQDKLQAYMDECKTMINVLQATIQKSLDKGQKNIVDLRLFSRNYKFFRVIYFFRKIMRVLLFKNNRNQV